MTRMQLGIIPTWQFSTDPGVNIKLNPHVTFPAGMDQRTVQPITGPIDQWPPTISERTWPNGNLQGITDALAFTDSWWWQNRKWLLLGGLGLAGFGIFSLLR